VPTEEKHCNISLKKLVVTQVHLGPSWTASWHHPGPACARQTSFKAYAIPYLTAHWFKDVLPQCNNAPTALTFATDVSLRNRQGSATRDRRRRPRPPLGLFSPVPSSALLARLHCWHPIIFRVSIQCHGPRLLSPPH